MANQIVINKRLGVKVPRSILLPPYLSLNSYFIEYTNAIDNVFGPLVDNKVRIIKNLRNMWVTNPQMEQKILDGEIVDLQDWSQPEREILVKQVNMLGMKLKTAGVLTDDNYQTISRFLGQYWFEKGTGAFIEFINFCLASNLEVRRLWSRDEGDDQYHDLTPELNGQPPGTPIWDGGEWFPTTHVELEASGGLGALDIDTLGEFFYEIANYNLVLNSIDIAMDLWFGTSYDDTSHQLEDLAIGLYYDPNYVVSNIEG